MKKKLTTLTLLILLMLTGCTKEDASSQTAEESIVPTITTDGNVCEWVDDTQKFGTYEGFLIAYTKNRSTNYVYPLPDIVDTWALDSVTLCRSNYTLNYDDTANGVGIMLEIGYNSTYEKISDYFNGIAYSDGNSSIVEMTDRYAIKHYGENSYAIIGLTGEENIRYTLVVGPSDESADIPALLKEYKELLEL